MSRERLLWLVLGLLAIGAIVYVVMNSEPTATTTPDSDDNGAICTMEAKICPDGSSVGRTGPSCEFATCPGEGECPDVCAAICAGEPEPLIPRNCPIPMCACDQPTE